MSHARVEFGLYVYNDGTIHLSFEDVLGDIGDIDLQVTEDGAVSQQHFDEDTDEDWYELVDNLHEFLLALYEKGQGIDHAR